MYDVQALLRAGERDERTGLHHLWTFEKRIGDAGAKALFEGVSAQLFKKGFIARGGQIIDATLVPAPKQYNSRGENELLEQGAMPADWKPARRREKDIDAT